MTVAGATDTTARVAALREEMRKRKVQAFVVPSEDAHQSEYIAESDARRAYISGFTGSAGMAVVTLDAAALWTDGRYFLQASKQLDSNWTLQKKGLPDVPSVEEWLVKVLPAGSSVGIDAQLVTVGAARDMADALAKAGHNLVSVDKNLVDLVWAADKSFGRPATPVGKVVDHPVKYAGRSREDKISDLKAQIAKRENVWGLVISSLDEIAWLFNLRGSDIAYNPVFFSYALITSDETLLYVDAAKFSAGVAAGLDAAKVTVKPYDAFFTELKAHSQRAPASKRLLIDARCSLAIQDATGGPSRVEETRSPVQERKALKNQAEIDGFRACHIRDAAALCEYFAWLEDELVVKGNKGLSEVDVADKLESIRRARGGDDFVGLSFDTISSTGSNGAIIHYKPEKGTCKMVDVNAIYLCDSGAQYKDGTTDVTRTLHFGTPTEREKEANTRVLKGHIQIDMTVFPRGTTGYILDVISRTALWKGGLDFRHGTGHGVGSYLNVHEGPHGLGPRIGYNDVAFEAGMTITNEPGYYEDGAFGIRIENVMVVKEVATKSNFGGRGFLGFEHVTVVPIQTKLVSVEMLTAEERQWLNSYNRECLDKVSPLLAPGSLALKWLQKETLPI